MLRRLLFSILTLTVMTANAQTLQRYEYWIDSDYSKHTTVSNTKEDISFSISTQDQPEGVHFLNFRAQNTNNEWGVISRYLYYVPEKLSENPTISGYEYWLDEDYSQKKSIQSTSTEISPVVDISKLTEGVHYYNFRAKNSDGVWGNLYRYLFYVPEATSENPTIKGYEHWFDDDYTNKTYTQSSTLNVTKSIDISSLKEGVHFFNFRAKNSDDVWGNLYRYLFYVPEAVNNKATLNGYEYWMDDDYSKRVTSVSTLGDVSLRIDISNLTEGVHYLNFRARNSEGVSSGLKRYLFYVPSISDTQGISPIVGYRYGFNSKTNYVRVTERQSLELNNLIVPIPSNVECANVEDGTFTINESTDKVTMSRTAKISFSMQFENKAGNWSSPTVQEFTQSDEIAKTAKILGVQKQVDFTKVSSGDYEVVKMVIPSSRTYYLRSNQKCDMQLYHNGSKMGSKVSGQTLKDTYNIGLDAGTYYAVLYNMVKDEENTADNVVLKLMLTDNVTPTPEIAYENEMVTISCAQEGAEIYYTIDGTDPTKQSNRYTSPFKLAHNAVVKAFAVYTDLAESYVADYKIDSYKVAKPTVEFTNLQLVMTTSTPDTRIYYTVDGSNPSTNGKLYTSPVAMSANATVRVIAKRDNFNDSEETVYQLDIANVKCASPTASVNKNLLTLSTTTSNAVIYYTMDGTTPTTSSSRYTTPVTLTENCVVKAIATREYWVNSPVMTYTVDIFKVEKPIIEFVNLQLVLSTATTNARIYYTTDGNDPLTYGKLYTTPVSLTKSAKVRAIAKRDNFNNSDEAVMQVDINTVTCAAPTFSHTGNVLTLSTTTSGASIFYTLDGTTPSASSYRYTAPITLTENCGVKAIAIKDNWVDSRVTEYSVDWFTVEKPEITFADGKVTITCKTPDTSIYYTIGGAVPTTSSTKYSQQITLTDNRIVQAIAVKKNFNNSAVASYTPGYFYCSAPVISFDGRDIIIETATNGAGIYYTTDGTTPSISSSRYTSKVRMSGLCTVKAIAVKNNMNDSGIISYALTAYCENDKAEVSEAGNLSKALQWADKSKMKTISVTGNINNADFECIRTMSSLEHLDISSVNIVNKTIPDNAFAGMNLIHISLPSSITSVGSRILGGCTRIAAIEWNATMLMPDDILGGIKLPNLLIYTKGAGYVSTSFSNIVVNDYAQNITLADDAISNFYCPKEFTAKSVSYTHNYNLPTIPGTSAGWESISLPFDVQTYTHTTKGNIVPFEKNDVNKKPFWLYEYSSAGFEVASDIKANTPYIISMPNNDEYIDDYILAGNVTFSSSNVKIKQSDNIILSEKDGYVFTPCFIHDAKDGKLAINTSEEYNGHIKGSIFALNHRAVKPFEGYMVNTSNNSKAILPIFDNDVSLIEDVTMYKNPELNMYSKGGVLYINSSRSCTINIHSIGGAIVRTVNLTEGINSIEGLSIGIYLINKKKIYIR